MKRSKKIKRTDEQGDTDLDAGKLVRVFDRKRLKLDKIFFDLFNAS